MGPIAAVLGYVTHRHICSCFTFNPRIPQPLPCVGQSVANHLTAAALPPNSGLSLALSQFLSASTSASATGSLWPMSSHIQTLLLSQAQTQAGLKHASCFTRTIRYLHRGLSHSDCGLVPLSSKRWLESEWESRGGEGRREVGRRRREEGRSFQEMMLLLVSD